MLAGCRMDLDVNVAVEEDGSGVVEVVVGLDADAVTRLGGDLEAVMELDDLRDAGWTIDGPDEDGDGITRVRISHPFGNAEEAADVFEQIAGAGGPFRDFAVHRTSSFAQTVWGFGGRIDFAGGLEALGDAGLAAELDGEPLGQSVEEIEEQLGESLNRLIAVRVSARLPGDVTSNAETTTDDGAVWQVAFGEGAVDLEAEGRDWRPSSLVLAGVAVSAALALVVLLLVRLARRLTRRDVVAR